MNENLKLYLDGHTSNMPEDIRLNKQEIIEVLIYGIKRKLEKDKSVLLNFQVFKDPTLRKIRREGVYGFGETRLPDGEINNIVIWWDWNEKEVNEQFTVEEIMDGFTEKVKTLIEKNNE